MIDINVRTFRKNWQDPTSRMIALDKSIKSFLGQAAFLYSARLKENISHTCHTLKDLEEMGYPFAKGNYGKYPGDPLTVHTHEGYMLNAWNKDKKTKYPGLYFKRQKTYVKTLGFDKKLDSKGYKEALWVTGGTRAWGLRHRGMYGRNIIRKTKDWFYRDWEHMAKNFPFSIGGNIIDSIETTKK